MRIAQVAPLYEAVPPRRYGGTERVISYLTEELVRRGHDVTLFATGDSQTSARLAPTAEQALWQRYSRAKADELGMPMHLAMLSHIFQQADDFDVIHCHVDYLAFSFASLVRTPVVTTLHGQLGLAYLEPALQGNPEAALVSISRQQRRPIAHLRPNWVGNVPNAVAVEEFPFNDTPGSYLLFVGRLSPEKRADWAIEIARRTGMPIKIAAKLHECERDYFTETLEPLFADPLVEYLGEVDEQTKRDLMRDAYALVFPIDWPEPFGMVMIEAMACGTPVLALDRGAVPEVLRDGVSGFIGHTVDDLVEAAPKVASLDRAAVRREAERRFSAKVMADGYEQVYERVQPARLTVPSLSGVTVTPPRMPRRPVMHHVLRRTPHIAGPFGAVQNGTSIDTP